MTTLDSKQININGTIFSFAQLTANPDTYIPLFARIFRASTMVKKADESQKEYIKRLFRNAYYTKHLAVTSDVTTETGDIEINESEQIANSTEKVKSCVLNTLGIDVVSQNSTT